MPAERPDLRYAAARPPRVRIRLYGLGSVFGKTLRDSRFAIRATAATCGLVVAAGGLSMATAYGTAATRLELAAMSSGMPAVLRGVYGNPIRVDTLGGFISWHYGTNLALLVGLWSILALSSTLAGEARRGSLDLVIATPRARRRVALQKIAAHIVAVGLAMACLALATWLTGVLVATMPGDAIAPDAALAFAAAVGVKGLVAGSIAFALAPLLGRAAAAGIAGGILIAADVVNGYRTVVPAFDSLAGASWFAWTFDHVPLAGQSDWPAIVLAAVAAALLLVLGVEGFARTDIGVTVGLPGLGLPAALLGLRGPLGRSFAESLPAAIAWGAGIALYGLVMAATSRPFTAALSETPGIIEAVRSFLPGVDISTSAGFLQVAFTDIGYVLVGLAAATFVAGRSGDETEGRLELQLAAPVSRLRWAVGSAVASMLAVVLLAAVLGGGIAIGIAAVGDDPVQPALGVIVLALYGTALVGLGVAVADLVSPSLAAPAILVIAVGTALLDILAPALRLPDWVQGFALTSHLGEPMLGRWDATGVLACLALAAGGVAAGAWGLNRRDISG